MTASEKLEQAAFEVAEAQANLGTAIQAARLEGMTLRAIAAIVEMSPETVRKLAAA